MASVFLSYDRDDAAAAGSVARVLEKAGHKVWWDREIAGGSEYSREIEQALADAEAVVVLWSAQSVKSPWVRDEAASGRDRGRLVPVRLDTTEPPLGFRQYQTVDLRRGRIGKAQQQALSHAVATATGAPTRNKNEKRRPSLQLQRRLWLIVGTVLALGIIGSTTLWWRPWADRNGVVLAVGPAGGDAASGLLARDLAIKLGALQAPMAGNLRIVEAAEAKNADLLFEASASGTASATLLLKSLKDSAILWSGDFDQPTGRRADLLQQVTFTAARIVGCAMEGLDGPVRLKPAPLKAYLNACAQMSDMASFDLRPPIPLLLQVIEASPRFEPAWSALLRSEAELVSPEASDAEPESRRLADLRRHILEARKINPVMPAADIAEAALLPARDFVGRAKLIERAHKRGQDDPTILINLAGAMSEVGRVNRAVDLAGQAASLDPLSPLLHSNYTSLIAYSGNFDAAKREIAKAEKLWPGTASLEDAQYRFHLRYGDPQIALALFNKHNDRGGRGPRMLLAARQNPVPENIDPFMEFVRERLRTMENPSAGIGFATGAFAQFNRADDFFSTLLGWRKPDDLAIISEVFFRPEYKEERRDRRFLLVAKRAGLLDYWQISGDWPDFCFETDFPYDCKAEAAKLR